MSGSAEKKINWKERLQNLARLKEQKEREEKEIEKAIALERKREEQTIQTLRPRVGKVCKVFAKAIK